MTEIHSPRCLLLTCTRAAETATSLQRALPMASMGQAAVDIVKALTGNGHLRLQEEAGGAEADRGPHELQGG